MGYYSAIETNEIVRFAEMKIETVTEWSQKGKSKYYVTWLTCEM